MRTSWYRPAARHNLGAALAVRAAAAAALAGPAGEPREAGHGTLLVTAGAAVTAAAAGTALACAGRSRAGPVLPAGSRAVAAIRRRKEPCSS